MRSVRGARSKKKKEKEKEEENEEEKEKEKEEEEEEQLLSDRSTSHVSLTGFLIGFF